MTKIIKLLFLIFLMTSSLLAKNQYFDEGINFFKNKKFEKAKFKFEQDIVINPKSELSYLYLSKIFNNLDKKKLEEQNLNTVILLNPKNEEAVFNLAKLKLEESDYKESKKIIEKLLKFCKDYCQKSVQLKTQIEKSLKK